MSRGMFEGVNPNSVKSKNEIGLQSGISGAEVGQLIVKLL
jgi:hypothetical protein